MIRNFSIFMCPDPAEPPIPPVKTDDDDNDGDGNG